MAYEKLATVDTFLLGRVTYEMFLRPMAAESRVTSTWIAIKWAE